MTLFNYAEDEKRVRMILSQLNSMFPIESNPSFGKNDLLDEKDSLNTEKTGGAAKGGYSSGNEEVANIGMRSLKEK